ncbi:MAG: helix-turn-helix transcriptional regulator [Fidelibacterota bacterium]|nr:MAG: helix-turn-helix transcriptional regulator [Candidatus Neomarinimicrobiota bacterium]
MVNDSVDIAKNLGDDLKTLRQLRNVSLAAIAKPAKISAAYLQKLENGMVKNPSPRVLMRLAEVLDCEYGHLMELAGYVTAGKPQTPGKISFLEAALRNEELTAEEQRAVMAFIRYLKGLRRTK